MEEDKKQEIDWQSVAKYKAAELENYIKRTRDAVNNAFNDGRAQVMVSIIPIADSLCEAIKGLGASKEVIAGITILKKKVDDILKSIGLEEMNVKVGDNFDPYKHSCVQAAKDGATKITSICQKGYIFAGKVVRPAIVML